MIPNTTPQRRLPLSDDTESNFAKNVSIFFPCASDLCPPEKEPYSCRFNRSNFFKRHLPLLPFEHIAHVTAVSIILFIYLLLLFYHSIYIYIYIHLCSIFVRLYWLCPWLFTAQAFWCCLSCWGDVSSSSHAASELRAIVIMASVLSENATNDWHQGGGNEFYKASCSHLTIQCCFSLLALNVVVTARLLLSCKQIMRIKVSQITVYHCSMYIVCSRHSHSIYSICCLNCTYDVYHISYTICVFISY